MPPKEEEKKRGGRYLHLTSWHETAGRIAASRRGRERSRPGETRRTRNTQLAQGGYGRRFRAKEGGTYQTGTVLDGEGAEHKAKGGCSRLFDKSLEKEGRLAGTLKKEN